MPKHSTSCHLKQGSPPEPYSSLESGFPLVLHERKTLLTFKLHILSLLSPKEGIPQNVLNILGGDILKNTKNIFTQMFIIGDLHIQNKNEAGLFLDYLNNRKEKLLVLIGDIIDFNQEILKNIKLLDENSKEKQYKMLINDYWELFKYFYENLEKQTISYLGTHEWFAIEGAMAFKITPDLALKNNRIQIMTSDFNEIEYEKIILAGLTIPGNGYSPSNPKFLQTKKKIEQHIREAVKQYNPTDPKNTIICTHDPIDIKYPNQGLSSLTDLLSKYPFKAHYHAHIHSNIHNSIINETPSINRSIIALAKFDPDILQPISNELLKHIKLQK